MDAYAQQLGDRFDALIAARRAAYDAARRQVFGADADRLPPSTPPPPAWTAGASLEEAWAATDAWATQALEPERRAWIAARLAPTVAPGATAAFATAAAGGLAQVNVWMEALFDLRRLAPAALARVTTVHLCHTADQFLAPLRAAGLATAGQAAPDVLAYHLPGQGCYVHGARLAQQAGVSTAAAAPAQPEAFVRAVRAVAAELWGWGFLLECTQEGRERLRSGVWQNELRLRLGWSAVPQPHWEAGRLVLRYGALSSEAWCAWIADRLEQAARQALRSAEAAVPPTRRSYWQVLLRLAHKIALAAPLLEVADGIREVLQDALADDDAGLRLLHTHINRLRRWGEQYEAFSLQHTGRSLHSWLGERLLERVEAQVGANCLPYAQMLAHHVTYDLEHVDPVVLARRLENEPRLAVDTRLRLLAGLNEHVKYAPETLRAAAWDRLQMRGPEPGSATPF